MTHMRSGPGHAPLPGVFGSVFVIGSILGFPVRIRETGFGGILVIGAVDGAGAGIIGAVFLGLGLILLFLSGVLRRVSGGPLLLSRK